MNIVMPGYWEIFGEKDIEIPAFYFHHEELINDHRKGGPQEMHYCEPNDTLKNDMPTLLPISEERDEENLPEDID
jgi:hypothetical protein